MGEFTFAARLPAEPADGVPLDNPIWSALSGEQRGLALGGSVASGQGGAQDGSWDGSQDGGSLALRYPAEIGPLCGLAEQSEAAYEALRALAGDEPVVQFLTDEWVARPGWRLLLDGQMDQMVWTEPAGFTQQLGGNVEVRALGEDDAEAMLALARMTKPGPFRERTHTLGSFFGVFEDGELVAMTGQRTRPGRFVEVSAVCTHPRARGRGYSRIAIAETLADIVGEGRTPMLHVFSANETAVRVYRSLGFTLRRRMQLAQIQAE